MTDNTPDTQELMAQLAAHEAEMDQLFAEMGLSPFDPDMDEAAHSEAYEATLPPIIKAAGKDTLEERHIALRQMVTEGADLNSKDPFGSDALDALFHWTDVAGMLILIDAGADVSKFEFDRTHLAVLQGDIVGAHANVSRDCRGRSPFLLACR